MIWSINDYIDGYTMAANLHLASLQPFGELTRPETLHSNKKFIDPGCYVFGMEERPHL